MTRDDIIRMAREAHHELVTKDYPGHLGQLDPWTLAFAERFAAIIAAAECERVTAEVINEAQFEVQRAVFAEREACARVCEEFYSIEGIAQRCAAAIRARGNT